VKYNLLNNFSFILSKIRNRSGGNQENELHGIGWNHYEQAVVIDFIANNSE
jgi:hypothetical protein